jgi:type IV pilus assembly protein PilM
MLRKETTWYESPHQVRDDSKTGQEMTRAVMEQASSFTVCAQNACPFWCVSGIMIRSMRIRDFSSQTPPIPSLLTFPSVGLDITDRRVRVLEFFGEKGALKVKRHGEMAVPPGVIVGGQIKRPVEFSAIMQSVKRTYRCGYAHVSLPEERAYIVHMDIPRVQNDEIRQSIAFQIEEYVPLKPENVVFDYTVLEEGPSDTLQVLVAAMPREDVEGYVNVLEEVGIIPLSFEIESQAIGRAIIPEEKRKEITMLVDIGRLRIGVSVVQDDAVRFTSTIDMGSETFSRALENALTVTPEEALKMKNALPLHPAQKDFYEALLPSLEKLEDELHKFYIYWHTYHAKDKDDQQVSMIMLSGGGANMNGLAPFLSQRLKVPVNVGNPWVNCCSLETYIPPIPHNKSLGYATVIGLALPHMMQ